MSLSLTSRYGKIHDLTIHLYQIKPEVHRDKSAKQKLLSWLKISKSDILFGFTKFGFETIFPLEENSSQFCLKETIKRKVSDLPTVKISRYLRLHVSIQLKKHFKHVDNVYIYEDKQSGIFSSYKGFQFHPECFPDGRFLIHFSSQSRCLITKDLKRFYHILKEDVNIKESDISMTVTDEKSGNKRKIYPSYENSYTLLTNFLAKHPDSVASVHPQVLSKVAPDAFRLFFSHTKNMYRNVIPALKLAASKPEPVDGMQLFEQPFLPVTKYQVHPTANIMTGKGAVVSKLAAIYYNGIYQPVRQRVVLPVVSKEMMNVFSFVKHTMDNHFNQGGEIQWLDVIHFLPEIDLNPSFIHFKTKYPKIFVLIITPERFHASLAALVQKNGIRFQLYSGLYNQSMVSNFVVRCLSKMNGIVSLLNNLHVGKDAYFAGIDLGHAHDKTTGKTFSQLIMVFFDSHGQQLYKSLIKNLTLNEVIQENDFRQGLENFYRHLVKEKRQLPAQLIIHRDGRIHDGESEVFCRITAEIFPGSLLEIVEIIKSNFPYLVSTSASGISIAESGTYWMYPNHNYGILVTNDQGRENGELPNPIVIKRKHGQIPFEHVMAQVYWFCKKYTNNIYFPTRLPATTEIANNLVGTGKKIYRSSYRDK